MTLAVGVTWVKTALSPAATAFTNTAVQGGMGVVAGMGSGLRPVPLELIT